MRSTPHGSWTVTSTIRRLATTTGKVERPNRTLLEEWA
jgi:hypothetical protein